MEQKIYVVYTSNGYEYGMPIGYFTSWEEAEKYCDKKNENIGYGDEYIYDLIENLSNKENNND